MGLGEAPGCEGLQLKLEACGREFVTPAPRANGNRILRKMQLIFTGKIWSWAELFTGGCGEYLTALLAAC